MRVLTRTWVNICSMLRSAQTSLSSQQIRPSSGKSSVATHRRNDARLLTESGIVTFSVSNRTVAIGRSFVPGSGTMITSSPSTASPTGPYKHCRPHARGPMSQQQQPSPHLLVRAARGEAVPRPPVWAMRQAGRWDPEFNRVRAGLNFYEFSADVDKAAAASLAPRRFGVDGIILFYDITTLPMAMGLSFSLKPILGPLPDRPVRTLADVE